MLWLPIAFLSALVFGFSGFMMKVGCEKEHDYPILLFGMYITGTALFALSLLYQQHWGLSLLVVASSVIIGIGSSAGNSYMIRALSVGPATLTSPLINLNVVLVIMMSMFIFNEQIKPNEMLALLLFIISCGLLSLDPRESLGIKDNKWFYFIFLAIIFTFLRNGGLKITQEIGLNNTLILFYAYLFSLVVFAAKFMPKGKLTLNPKHKQGLFIGAIAGIFSYGGLELYAYALQTGPASIVATIFSLRSLVMVIMAMLIYKEGLTYYQKMSLLVLFIGMGVISL